MGGVQEGVVVNGRYHGVIFQKDVNYALYIVTDYTHLD